MKLVVHTLVKILFPGAKFNTPFSVGAKSWVKGPEFQVSSSMASGF